MVQDVVVVLIAAILGGSPTASEGLRTSQPTTTATPSVSVQCAHPEASLHPPLVKKFQGYNSGLVSLEHTARDAHLFRGVGMEWMRVDVGMGWDEHRTGPGPKFQRGVFGSVVERGLDGELTVDLTPIRNHTATLAAHGVRPVYSWCYTPTPLQPAGGNWTSGPVNLTEWRAIHKTLAAALRGMGAIHELYNEPDLSWALAAPWDWYLQMYKAAAEGVREGDPNAEVIGPAMAFPVDVVGGKLHQFLNFVAENDLPLDALSVHAYGADNIRTHLAAAKAALASGPSSLANLPIHLNEVNVVDTAWPIARQQSVLDNYTVAGGIFATISDLVAESQVAQVHWAQFTEPGANATLWGGPWGVVNLQGVVKASYNAFVVYNRMPLTQCTVDVAGSSVSSLAAGNGTRVAAAIWSDSDSATEITAGFDTLPFGSGVLTVYRIDAGHCSFDNTHNASAAGLAAVETRVVRGSADARWTGVLPPRAFVYLEVNAGPQC